MKELQGLQSSYSDIQAKGGEIIAVSSDTSEEALASAEKQGFKFHLVADSELRLIKQFKLLHEGGKMGDDTSRPAIYFIRTEGTVSSAVFRDNYRHIFTPEDVMKSFNDSVTAE